MKRGLTFIMLTMFAVPTMAQEQPKPIDDATLKMFILEELCSGHHPPMDEVQDTDWRLPTAQDVAETFGISSNRMVRVLEEMVLENLLAFEANPSTYDTLNVFPLIEELQTFHSTNTVTVLKKCLMSPHKATNDRIFRNAAETYVVIEGVKAIPFFRETLNKEGLDPAQHNRITQHLQNAIVKLREKNKTDDAEKIKAFVQEMRQAAGKGEN